MSDADLPDSPNPPGRPVPPDATGQTPDAYLPDSNWSYGAVAAAVFAGYIAISLVAPIMLVATGWETVQDIPLVVGVGIQLAAGLLVLGWLSQSKGTRSWRRDFGLEIRLRHAWGLFAGVAIQYLVAIMLVPLVRLAGEEGPQQAIARETASLDGWELAAITVLVVAVGPLIEEVVYRGMLLGRLVKTMSNRSAIAISAAVFALIHLADPNALLVVPGLFIIGLALGYLAIRAGHIGVATFAHAGINGLAVAGLVWGEELQEVVEPVEAILALFPF